MTISEDLSAFAYKAGWALTARLPEPLAVRLFDMMADVASKKGRGPEQLRKNLSRVVGPEHVTRDLVRRSMRSYLRYWREAFQLPALAGPELAARLNRGFDAASLNTLDASISRGRGVVLALPHSGNWDMAGMWLVQHHGEFTTVAERLKPESLFQAFVEFRESLGFNVIALTGEQDPPMTQMEKVLRAGGIVCLMGERDLTGHGAVVNFFGEQTSMPTGAARLAKTTGAKLHVAHVSFEDERRSGAGSSAGKTVPWRFRVSAPLDTTHSVNDIVQEQADEFARDIAAHPADWHMLQPLWFSDLSARRLERMGVAQ